MKINDIELDSMREVGEIVGVRVGLRVVGKSVGWFVGLRVGEAEVGTNVGDFEGDEEVGNSVGKREGELVAQALKKIQAAPRVGGPVGELPVTNLLP
jgi:hypothetical protein